MLKVANLSVAYGQHRALDNVAIEIAQGEIVTILGANGAGKTSLLKAIAGVVKTLPGKQVSLGTHDLSALPAHEIVERGLALVPEGRGIFGDLTVKENLLLGANPETGPRRRGRAAGKRFCNPVPAAARASLADRPHHERRRAADAGDRPRADVEPGYFAARRALARPVADSWSTNCSPTLASGTRGRHGSAAGRTERPGKPCHRRPRLLCWKTARSSITTALTILQDQARDPARLSRRRNPQHP